MTRVWLKRTGLVESVFSFVLCVTVVERVFM
jgi:hypothetical protein